jgi:hypothetical protein
LFAFYLHLLELLDTLDREVKEPPFEPQFPRYEYCDRASSCLDFSLLLLY